MNALGIPTIGVSAKESLNINKLFRLAKESSNCKFNTVGTWMMIAGMPNVGKSTIINKLRNKVDELQKEGSERSAIVRTGKKVCTTKKVTGFKINNDPLSYLIDVPGIMVPRLINDEIGLKLSLIGCIKDEIAG